MQKAMFLLESYRKGILPEVDGGFIFTINAPDRDDSRRVLDPFRLEMISYSGMRSIHESSDGLRFYSLGRKTFALIEPTAYPHAHVDPAFRSSQSTAHMPFRLKECTEWMTGNNRYRILMPTAPVDFADAFTVEFPGKGDVCIIYFAFDTDIHGVVLPYIEKHLRNVVQRVVGISTAESERVCSAYMANVAKFHVALQS